MKKLSDKQKRIIGYIERFLSEKGYPPSIRDIQSGCKISSTSVVDYNLNILEREGYLEDSLIALISPEPQKGLVDVG